jgi:hypothetical protein
MHSAKSAWSQTDSLVAGRPRHQSTSEDPTKARGQEAPLSEINWAVELRKIEREYDGLPPEPTPSNVRQKRDAERRERERQDAIAASFGVYFRLTLVMCLAISLVCWPYDVTCGAMLSGYLLAVIILVVGGIWTALATFTHRMPWRHLTALLMIFWGLCLGAAQVLPRIGYANPIPGRATQWTCAE